MNEILKEGVDINSEWQEPNGNPTDITSLVNEENQWILKKYDWDLNKLINAYKESSRFYSADKPKLESEIYLRDRKLVEKDWKYHSLRRFYYLSRFRYE